MIRATRGVIGTVVNDDQLDLLRGGVQHRRHTVGEMYLVAIRQHDYRRTDFRHASENSTASAGSGKRDLAGWTFRRR
jgi:hypothetical protein